MLRLDKAAVFARLTCILGGLTAMLYGSPAFGQPSGGCYNAALGTLPEAQGWTFDLRRLRAQSRYPEGSYEQ